MVQQKKFCLKSSVVWGDQRVAGLVYSSHGYHWLPLSPAHALKSSALKKTLKCHITNIDTEKNPTRCLTEQLDQKNAPVLKHARVLWASQLWSHFL